MRSRVIKPEQQADNTYVPRRCLCKIPKKKYFLHHKQESPQHSITATTAIGVEDAIQESGAEHLTTTNKASGVEEIVADSDADSIAYCSDSSTPQTIMDPVQRFYRLSGKWLKTIKQNVTIKRLKGKDYNWRVNRQRNNSKIT